MDPSTALFNNEYSDKKPIIPDKKKESYFLVAVKMAAYVLVAIAALAIILNV